MNLDNYQTNKEKFKEEIIAEGVIKTTLHLGAKFENKGFVTADGKLFIENQSLINSFLKMPGEQIDMTFVTSTETTSVYHDNKSKCLRTNPVGVQLPQNVLPGLQRVGTIELTEPLENQTQAELYQANKNKITKEGYLVTEGTIEILGLSAEPMVVKAFVAKDGMIVPEDFSLVASILMEARQSTEATFVTNGQSYPIYFEDENQWIRSKVPGVELPPIMEARLQALEEPNRPKRKM